MRQSLQREPPQEQLSARDSTNLTTTSTMKYLVTVTVLLIGCQLCPGSPLPYPGQDEQLGQDVAQDVMEPVGEDVGQTGSENVQGRYRGYGTGSLSLVGYGGNQYQGGYVQGYNGNLGGYNGYPNVYSGQGGFVPGVRGYQGVGSYQGVGQYNRGLYNGGVYNGGLYNGGVYNGALYNGVQPNGGYLNGGVVGGNVWK